MNALKLKTLSFSITCIFLCGAFSAKGQDRGNEGPLEQALRWERAVFDAEDPQAMHEALLGKAGCYADASLFEDAVRTLDRIRLYLLPPEEVSEVLFRKALWSKEAGDFGAALGYLEESGKAEDDPALYSVLLARARRFPEAREQALRCDVGDSALEDAVLKLFDKAPRLKKEGTAAVLSFLPPAGQVYLKEPGRGLAVMLMNAGAAAFTALELIDHSWITGILGGGLLLDGTFFKANMERNLSRVEEANSDSAKEFSEKLERLLLPGNDA